MKKLKYEMALEFINENTGQMLTSDDVCRSVGMGRDYAANLLDCIYATGGGQHKSAGRCSVYVFDYLVTMEHIRPFLNKKREGALASKARQRR